MSRSNALAVLRKPRVQSSVLNRSIAMSSITASAPGTPPADQAFKSVHRRVGLGRACRQFLCERLGCLCDFGFGNDVGGYAKLARERSGDRLAQHGKARRASPPDPLSEALQRARDRQHSCRDLHATEDGVIGGYNEVAVESELETTAKRDPLDRGDRRHPERFDGAIRQIDLGHKGAKPIDVFAGPFPHLASEAEVRSLRFDQHNADVAFARVMDSLPKTFRKPQVEPVNCTASQNPTHVAFVSACTIRTSWEHPCDRDHQLMMERSDRVGNVTLRSDRRLRGIGNYREWQVF